MRTPRRLATAIAIAALGVGAGAALVAVTAASAADSPAAGATAASASTAQAGLASAKASAAGSPRRFAPLTPWRKPRVRLPKAHRINYLARAEAGVRQAAHWRRGNWYCEYLHCKCPNCSSGYYPMLTIWGSVPMFEALDAIDIAKPTPAHRAQLDRFARYSEHYWNPYRKGYSPYPNDRKPGVRTWFDDNGWLGLAFVNAYDATGERRYLHDAQRAFTFVATQGWDATKGGGMWWNTDHPYHSGPALAADTLLGMLLYEADHEPAQLEAVKTFVDWANANDIGDERKLYLEKENNPNTVNDYVQAPLVYAQYLLCRDGQGEAYCVRAGRVAATISEQHVNKTGYRYNHGPSYDAIFMQWMTGYGAATKRGWWLRLAQVNAAAAARHANDGDGLWLGSWWGGPIPDRETHPEMFRTMASTTSLYAWLAVYSRKPGASYSQRSRASSTSKRTP